MRQKETVDPARVGVGGSGPSAEAVTIPGVLLDFLERASLAFAGTRTADLVPHLHRVNGWRVGPDRRTITFLVREGYSPHLLESLEDNGEIALTVEEIGPHETYQFKGRFLDAGSPDDDEDRHAFERARDRYVGAVSRLFGFPEEKVRRHFRRPEIAVRFEVREIFVQTPGPGAGKRLVPPESA
jgi:hypothetical protein